MTSVRCPDGVGNAPINRFSNVRGFARPQDRTVVAPNVDTLYSIAHLDLGRGPIVLSHPDMGDRYFVFEFLDPYTNVIGYVGTRTTGAGAGRFAITWTGHPGRRLRGVPVVRSKYRRVWVIGRTLASDKPDQRRARKLMARYGLTPLRRLAGASAPAFTGGAAASAACDPGKPRKSPVPTGLRFFDALGRALKQNPPPARDRPLLDRLAEVGVGPGRRPSKEGLDPAVLDGLRQGYELESTELPGRAREEIARMALANGGWYALDPRIGAYGTAYEFRAAIALVGLGANTPEEALYPIGLGDSEGRLLNGANRYRITFAPGDEPPARAFWSLTMYDLDGFLIANPVKRYAVGSSHPPLIRRNDGSIVIAIQKDPPTESKVNWLPAPEGAFRLNLRLYWPERSALTGSWKPPPVLRSG